MKPIADWIHEISEHISAEGNEPSSGRLAKWISNMRRKVRDGEINPSVLERHLVAEGLRADLFVMDNRAIASLKLAEINLRFIKDHPGVGYAKSSDPTERRVNRWLMNTRRAYRTPSDTKSIFYPEYKKIAEEVGLPGIFERVYKEPELVHDD